MKQRTINMTDRSEISALLRQNEPFAVLNEEEVARLTEGALRYRLEPGEVVFGEGTRAERCVLVAEGAIAGVRYTEGGDEKRFRSFGPGDVIGLTAMFLPEASYLMTARVVTPSRAYGLSRSCIRALTESNGRFAARLLEHTSYRLRTSLNQVDFFTGSSAEQRVAAFLWQLHVEQGSESITLPFQQKQIAVLLGVREETISRVLSQFRRDGILAPGRGAIGLMDIDVLQQLAGPHREHLRIGSF